MDDTLRFEEELASGLTNGPLHDEHTLVFDVRDSEAVRSSLTSGGQTNGGVEHMLEYVARHGERASLMPVGERAARDLLSGLHHLRLADRAHGSDLSRALRSDDRIRYVHHPVIHYPLAIKPVRERSAGADADVLANRQWGLTTCHFRDVWKQLDKGADPGAIAVIDAGAPTHPELTGRIDRQVQPLHGKPTRSIHAGAVAGVIAAIRGNHDVNNMEGACSGHLTIYSVWNDVDFDSASFYAALKDVAAKRFPVLNLSLGARTSDATVDALIRDCVKQGVTVVAAMGDLAEEGSPPVYPAAHPDVIAVGGTDRADRKTRISSTGSHIWIAAPGDDIWTLHGNSDFMRQTGTSFSSAFVTAAVWLAQRGGGKRTPAQMRQLLKKSVDGETVKKGRHSNSLGYGRLDMLKLAKLVKATA